MWKRVFKKEKRIDLEELKEIDPKLKYGYPLISLLLLIFLIGGYLVIFGILVKKLHQALTIKPSHKTFHFHLEKIKEIKKMGM